MKNNSILLLLLSVFIISCEEANLDMESVSEDPAQVFQLEKQKVVFIAGFDEDDNSYYANALKHFRNRKMGVVEGLFSLQEIIHWLNENSLDTEYEEIHIVSHSNAWRGMSLQTTQGGERITLKTITQSLKSNQLPHLNNGITNDTRIIFHSCGLGENRELLKALKRVLTAEISPKVYAAKHFNVFGGKFASHYLAKPYYVFYPTAQSKGPNALAKEIEKSYPEKKIDWKAALTTRQETKMGIPYSYRFNIPVNWKIEFDDKKDIPSLEDPEAIMDWIAEDEKMASALYQLGIPLEKFRWNSKVKGRTLQISGKTTVLTVLEPILSQSDLTEYEQVDLDKKSLYSSW